MDTIIASLPDELISNIASFIKLKPTIQDRYSKLLTKLTRIYCGGDEEWMRKVEKNPRFYGYRSFKICKKIIKYQVVGETTDKLYNLRIEEWNSRYAEFRMRHSIIHTLERLEGCATKPNRIVDRKMWHTIGIW